MVDRVGPVGGNANVPSGGDNDKKIALQVLKELQQLLQKLKKEAKENDVDSLDRDLTTFLTKIGNISPDLEKLIDRKDFLTLTGSIVEASQALHDIDEYAARKQKLLPESQDGILQLFGDIDTSLTTVIGKLK